VGVLACGHGYTHEDFTKNQPSDQKIEALIGLQYRRFRFDRYNLQSQISMYPEPVRCRSPTHNNKNDVLHQTGQ
jgi:hypothetical protein